MSEDNGNNNIDNNEEDNSNNNNVGESKEDIVNIKDNDVRSSNIVIVENKINNKEKEDNKEKEEEIVYVRDELLIKNTEKALELLLGKFAYAFAGGGVLGICEVGAISRMCQLLNTDHLEAKCIVGTSVGSIIGTVVACKATVKFMEKKMFGIDLKSFQDNSNCQLKNLLDFWKKLGWYDGEAIKTWTGELLRELSGKEDITFRELYDLMGTYLIIVYLSETDGETQYADHITKPDMEVREAIRRSTAIPFYYKPVIENSSGVNMVYSDGGSVNNYPINVLRDLDFDEQYILGFKICPGEDKKTSYTRYVENVYLENMNRKNSNGNDKCYGKKNKSKKGGSKSKKGNRKDNKKGNTSVPKLPIVTEINNPIDRVFKLIDIVWQQAARVHVHEDDWKLTVKIMTGDLTSTDFNITEEQAQWLYQQGRKATDKYVEELISRM